MSFAVRYSLEEDLPRMLAIYERARIYMASLGNPHQWGDSGYPSVSLLREDIARGVSYVVADREGEVVATFVFVEGEDPTYSIIEGAWLNEQPYGVIHRLASSGREKGIARFVFDWCSQRSCNLRVDTHAQNLVMQHLFLSLGFVPCGTIFLPDGSPRLAYQRIIPKPSKEE
ncbi:GNAT family N-acetyltransferase [Porphyromonas endodontalis]|uniref:GNAT family N-acetyltransferase n=1 Tax=Porphyromonas endodontalis TaxID=28124 RepID=UPI0036134EB3